MLYALEAGDLTGSHTMFFVDGPVGLDLDALWSDFHALVDEHIGMPPDVVDRALWHRWYRRRWAYLGSCYQTMTGREILAGPFMLTDLFTAWLCRHHACTRPAVTHFETEL